MTQLENENKSLTEQRELFLKDNEAMKEQIQILEQRLDERNMGSKGSKTTDTTQIIQIINQDVKEDYGQF